VTAREIIARCRAAKEAAEAAVALLDGAAAQAARGLTVTGEATACAAAAHLHQALMALAREQPRALRVDHDGRAA
jgi:hypothetical protein